MGPKLKSYFLQTPFRLVVITAVSFLVAEAFIMYFIHLLLRPMPFFAEVLLDAFILTIVGFLILYVFLFRPMIMHINERREAEEAATRAYLELNQVFQTAADGMRLIDKDFNTLKANETFASMTGFDKDAMIGKKCYDIFPGPKCHTAECSMRRILSGEERVEFESIKQRQDGTDISCIITATPFKTLSGELIGIVEDFSDITDRKRAEEDVIGLQKQIEFILGATKTRLDIIDSAYNIRFIDPEWQKLNGNPSGKKCYEYFMAGKEGCPGCGVAKALETKTIVISETVLNSEGDHPFQVTSMPFQGRNGEWLVAQVYFDISERKKIEEEHLKIAKLESLGILAGGIAHDFNNILTAIVGSISFAKLCLSKEDDVYEALIVAEQASLRAKDLTRRLLTFSKGGEPIRRTVSIPRLLRNTAGFVLSGSSSRCVYDLKDNLSNVEADEGQITQVFNNILLNAIQAMPEGGTVRVEAENIVIEENDIVPVTKGKYVKVSISDQGGGVPQENIKKIFDPYFTTKPQGSGLGLATAYSIVEKHHGYIHVESDSGTGTTFSVYLPASESRVLIEEKEEAFFPSGKGRVLVMDDEEILRNFAGRMLEKAGYQVSVATDGVEAVELFEKAKELGKPFDVVVLDLTVPGGAGGKETILRLLEIEPSIRAIVSSGYSNDPIMANYWQYGFKAVVEKPYSINELTRAIEDVVSGNDNQPEKSV